MNHSLKKLREENRFSQKEVAKLLGISQSAYSQIENGTVSISVEHLKTLCEEYEVSMDWLVFGEGSRRKGKDRKSSIPLININAVAGYLDNLKDPDYIGSLDFYSIPGFETGQHRIFEVSGESMKPVILPNDYVVCSEVGSLGDLLEGSVCVIVESDRVSVKRVYFGNAQMLTMKSDNPRFGSRSLDRKEVLEAWLVKSKITGSLTAHSEEQEKRIKKLENGFSEVKNHLNTLLSRHSN